MPQRVHCFGIRHHGPGSAWSLERALEQLNPAIVLVEGPPEANELIPFVVKPGMKPPVALLVHAVDDPTVSSFYPFAEFSPEWVALRWAVTRGRPVRFIDLPVASRLPAKPGPEEEQVEGEEAPDPDSLDAVPEPPAETEAREVRQDPLSRLAGLAGYDDGEAW